MGNYEENYYNKVEICFLRNASNNFMVGLKTYTRKGHPSGILFFSIQELFFNHVTAAQSMKLFTEL